MLLLDITLPWHPGVDPFWKGFWASAAAFFATVVLTVLVGYIGVLRRRRERASEDERLRDSLAGALYVELLENLSLADNFRRKCEQAKQGVPADLPMHRMSNVSYQASFHDLIGLGLPRHGISDIAQAYDTAESANRWLEWILTMSPHTDMTGRVALQAFALPTATNSVRDVRAAMAVLERWMESLGKNIAEVSGIRDWVKQKYPDTWQELLGEKPATE